MTLPYTTKKVILNLSGQQEALIPVSSDQFTTKETEDTHFQSGMFIIAFYDSTGNVVTPTSGDIKVEISPIEGQWLNVGNISASEAGEIATYEPPVITGPMIQGRVTLSGVTGVSHFKAFFWRV